MEQMIEQIDELLARLEPMSVAELKNDLEVINANAKERLEALCADVNPA